MRAVTACWSEPELRHRRPPAGSWRDGHFTAAQGQNSSVLSLVGPWINLSTYNVIATCLITRNAVCLRGCPLQCIMVQQKGPECFFCVWPNQNRARDSILYIDSCARNAANDQTANMGKKSRVRGMSDYWPSNKDSIAQR